MHQVPILSKNELWPLISIFQESFDQLTHELESLVSFGPPQYYDPQENLKPQPPQHRLPINLQTNILLNTVLK